MFFVKHIVDRLYNLSSVKHLPVVQVRSKDSSVAELGQTLLVFCAISVSLHDQPRQWKFFCHFSYICIRDVAQNHWAQLLAVDLLCVVTLGFCV